MGETHTSQNHGRTTAHHRSADPAAAFKAGPSRKGVGRPIAPEALVIQGENTRVAQTVR
jgi:hypothetical protein